LTAVFDECLIYADNVKKYFSVKGSYGKNAILKAVDGVAFGIIKGETFGLVGESGCGKSTLAQVMLRLVEATEGSVYFEGRDIYKLKSKELREVRREMQIIFQDPYDSLNPRMTLGEIVAEPLNIHGIGSSAERVKKVKSLFSLVGLPEQQLNRYPHQLSGGQRQRVSIARSIALSPKLLVCDEAVSALDVSIQSQILNLLSDLKKELKLTYLFVSHDLSVVRFISDYIGVMYFGRLIEMATKHEIFANRKHPYTHALLTAVPNPDPRNKSQRVILKGDVPSLLNPPVGCIFYDRCAYAEDCCRQEAPALKDISDNHFVACHRAHELNLMNR
jgi:oligopeptide/dipeptide ABC transporter ATP-binding protein